jgi:hypothetical protein
MKLRTIALFCAANLGSCLFADVLAGSRVPPAIPSALSAPAGDVLRLKAYGKGVQIYQCTAATDQPDHYQWTLQGPEAQLLDRKHQVIGKHYAGPTWEAADGSRVIGEVVARDDGPDPTAIPWLLLNAKSVSGKGVLGEIHTIQRLNTRGGKAPPAACDAGAVSQVVRVPYTADYYFYRSH